MSEVSALLALLYAGPRSVVCRRADGGLEVAPAHRAHGLVVLTQDELLEAGVEALLELAVAP